MYDNCPVIGVDVAKDFCYYAVLTPTGRVHENPFKALNTKEGLELVLNKIEEVTQTFMCKPALVLESTGHYSNRLVHFFLNHDMKVFLINPLMSNSIRKSAIRKVKNDEVDAKGIAKLYFIHDLRQYHQEDTYLENLKVLTRTSYNLTFQRSKNINQLTATVEQIMPNYTKVFNNIASKTSIAILNKYPSPQDILAAPKSEIISLIKVLSIKSFGYARKKYDSLLKMAEESLYIGIDLDAYSHIVRLYARQVRHIDEQLKKLSMRIKELSLIIPEVQLLSTIPGIGSKLAPMIAAEIGSIARFRNSKQLVGYCGIDPAVNQSGKFKGDRNKLSKRGSPFVRRALYLAATVSIRKNSNGSYVNKVIYDYYHKKTKTKAKKQALGAIMNKLLRIIFSVLKNQRPFVLITPEQQVKMYKANMKLVA